MWRSPPTSTRPHAAPLPPGTSGSTSSGQRYPQAVVSLVSPDGFPFSVRVPITVDQAARRIRLGGAPVGVPWQPGLACVTAHDHAPDFSWQRNFQVRGDLVEEDGAWAVVPQRLVGGFELPPTSTFERYRVNARKVLRFRKIARARCASELARPLAEAPGSAGCAPTSFPQGAGWSDSSPLTAFGGRCSTSSRDADSMRKERGHEV